MAEMQLFPAPDPNTLTSFWKLGIWVILVNLWAPALCTGEEKELGDFQHPVLQSPHHLEKRPSTLQAL